MRSRVIIAVVILILILVQSVCVCRRLRSETIDMSNEDTPKWLTGYPLTVYKHKINVSPGINEVVAYQVGSIKPNFTTKRMSWKEFENTLNTVDLQSYDVIIGIASGGAIMAQYLASISELPVSYIKIKHYADSNIISRISKIIHKKKLTVQVIDEIPDLTNKRVLVVDDFSFSGNTLLTAVSWVKDHGGIPTTIVLSDGGSSTADISLNDKLSIGTPWGYDA